LNRNIKPEQEVDMIKRYLIGQGAISEDNRITELDVPEKVGKEEPEPVILILTDLTHYRHMYPLPDFVIYDGTEYGRQGDIIVELLGLVGSNRYYVKLTDDKSDIAAIRRETVSGGSICRLAVSDPDHSDFIDNRLVYRSNRQFLEKIASQARTRPL
jgi:hypothetical protein